MAIRDALKKFYYFFEDKYYALLDVINKRIPIYKVIDPIDRVVPSFVLFVVIAVALVASLYYLFVFAPSQGFVATIKLVDEETNVPLPNVQAILTLPDGNKVSITTNDEGTFDIQLKQPQAAIVIEPSGFERYENPSQQFIAGENVIRLTSVLDKNQQQCPPQGCNVCGNGLCEAGESKASCSQDCGEAPRAIGPYDISVIDEESRDRISGKSITIIFVCSNPDAIPPMQQTTNNGFFAGVTAPGDCGVLTANFVAEGYKQKNNVLVNKSPTEVALPKDEPVIKNGKVEVEIKDASIRPVVNANLQLLDDKGVALFRAASDTSGRYVFETVLPGGYKLSVSTQDGRSATKSFLVEGGKVASVSISLPNESTEKKKILLSIVDSISGEPINNVDALFYADDAVFKHTLSDFNGIISVPVSPTDETKRFSVVLFHTSYVLKEARGLVVINSTDTDSMLVSMEKILTDMSNYGNTVVSVIDDQNKPVQNALVALFSESFDNPLFAEQRVTDANGAVSFLNLKPGAYHARARKPSFDSVDSEIIRVEAKKTTVAIVRIFFGKGGLKVKVVDKQKQPIKDANVEFIDLASLALLDSCVSGSDGICLSRPLMMEKHIVMRAKAQGYLSEATLPFTIVKDVNREVVVSLEKRSEVKPDNLSVSFAGLFNEEGLQGTLVPNKAYIAKFFVVVPSDGNYSNLVLHVRAGLDSQADANSSIVVIKNAVASMRPIIRFSRQSNPADPFDNPSIVESDSNAKQANITWEKPDANILEVNVMLFIKPSAQTDAPVEIHYQAKTLFGGTELKTTEFLQKFKVGQNWCLPNCPTALEWYFELQAPDGTATPVSPLTINEMLTENQRKQLKISYNYKLLYKIFNLSTTDFTSATLELESNDANKVFKFAGHSETERKFALFSNVPFPGKTVKASDASSPIDFNGGSEASFADMNFFLAVTPEMPSGDTSNKRKLSFSVVGDDNLSVQLPRALPPSPQSIDVIVKNIAGSPLSNATVQVWVDSMPPAIGAIGAIESPQTPGLYTASFASKKPENYAFVQVEYPGMKKFAKKVFVTGELIELVSNFDYGCITADANLGVPDNQDVMYLTRGNLTSMAVKSKNCNYDVTVAASVPSYLSGTVGLAKEGQTGMFNQIAIDLPRTDLWGNIPQYETGAVFSVKTAPKSSKASDNAPIGKIPIYINAKFSRDTAWHRVATVYLGVSDPQSCFSLRGVSNIIGAEGTITETTMGDFNQGTLQNIDLLTAPNELRIAISSGSPIVDLGGNWFAVPGTRKLYAFPYNNPAATIDYGDMEGVVPTSTIAATSIPGYAGTYIAVAADGAIWTNSSAGGGARRWPAPGVTTKSKIAAYSHSSYGAYFAVTANPTTADGPGIVYEIQAAGSPWTPISWPIQLQGVTAASNITASSSGWGGYFAVVGDDTMHAWHWLSSSPQYGAQTVTTGHKGSWSTPGTRSGVSKVVNSYMEFATVADNGRAYYVYIPYIVQQQYPNYAPVQLSISGVNASSNMIYSNPLSPPSQNGHFITVGTNKIYSWPAEWGGVGGQEMAQTYEAPGVTPQSNIAAAHSPYFPVQPFFAVAATNNVYAGQPRYSSPMYPLRSFVTPGTIPTSSVAVYKDASYHYFFAALAPNKTYLTRWQDAVVTPRDYTTTVQGANIQGLAADSPLTTDMTDQYGGTFAIAVGINKSYLWSADGAPRDFNTLGTIQKAEIGFDASTFVVPAPGKAYLIPKAAYSNPVASPISSIALGAGTSACRNSISGVLATQGVGTNNAFIIVGSDCVYSFSYGAATPTYFNFVGVAPGTFGPQASYISRNYAFSQDLSRYVMIKSVSWGESKPEGTTVSAYYSTDNGTTWSGLSNGTIINTPVRQFRLKMLFSTSNLSATPAVRAISIPFVSYTPTGDGSAQNKYVFLIDHVQDHGTVQMRSTGADRCYAWASNPLKPTLDIVGGIDKGSVVLRYSPMPAAGMLDSDHYGEIDFNISNRALIGEDNFALLEVEDSHILGATDYNKERFMVQLVGERQSECAMVGGIFGRTGDSALPRTKLKWNWSDISATECDQNNENFVFCDSTQFSIMLLKKLKEIMELGGENGNPSQANKDRIQALSHFNAYLMKDGLGRDLRLDLDYYLTQRAFLGVDTYYRDKLTKYFKDTTKLAFSSDSFLPVPSGSTNTEDYGKIVGKPGLYKVDVSYDFGTGTEYRFFSYGISGYETTATITVSLSYLGKPPVASAFYEAPFDGVIGFAPRPSENSVTSRIGYGLGFSGAQIDLASGYTTQSVASASNPITVSKGIDFNELLASKNRGLLLSLDLADMQNKSLRLTPNYATPVIMGIESTADSNIGGYYKLYKKLPDGTPLLITDAGISGTKADINSFWTGIASSMACRDFKSDPLFYNLSDRNAFSFAEICDDRNGSRGFRWVNIPATNRSGKKLFLQTIFYTPAKESYSIKRACAERTIFASPTTVVPVNEDREIQLNYSKPSDAVMEGASWMPSIQSLFEMVSDAGGRKVCISTTTTPDGNAVKAELWWNPQAMARALEENKQRMVPADSGWNCPIEGTIALGVSE